MKVPETAPGFRAGFINQAATDGAALGAGLAAVAAVRAAIAGAAPAWRRAPRLARTDIDPPRAVVHSETGGRGAAVARARPATDPQPLSA